MTTTQLAYHGLVSGLSDGGSPRLQMLTPAGQVREVPLDRRQLLRIIKAAVNALEFIDQHGEQR